MDINSESYILDSFSVENYKSFLKRQTINFDGSIEAFYGSNASGKSNFFNALLVFRRFIEHSADPNSHGTPYDPFLLSEDGLKKPSSFSILFHNNNGERYRYNASVFQNKVTEEEMFDETSSRPRLIFRRSNGYTEASGHNGFGKKMFEGDSAVREDSLLITFARSTNNRYANAVYMAVKSVEYINLASTPINTLKGLAVRILQKKPNLHEKLVEMLKEADFSVNNLSYSVTKMTPEMLIGLPFAEEVKRQILATGQTVMVNTTHSVRNSRGDKIKTILFDMETQESLGTNIFFVLAIAILDIVDDGKTLYVDEFGASTHTKLCEFIVKFFKNNKNGARLLINTHDTGLIKNGTIGILEREDILIVEKDMLDETIITPLKDKMQRTDENIGKKYILGLYGGIPILSEAN